MLKSRKTMCIFLTLIMMTIAMLGNIQAKAETVLPEITFVGVEHSPLVEGDSEAFYLVSKNYTGDVQYRVLLYTEAKDVYEDITNGYTEAVNPGAQYKIVPSKTFALGKYKLLVYVKRAGTTGIKSDSNGDYDSTYTSYLNCINRDDSNRVYANGEMQVERTAYAVGESIVVNGIEGISGMKAPYNYKLNYYDVGSDKWMKEVTGYSSNITWKAEKAGTYMLDVWTKSSDSMAEYESWKLKEINVEDADVYKEDGKSYTGDSDKTVIITGKSISYKNAKVNGNIYIYGDNVTLENINVTGNIIIDPGKDGNTNLNTVAAKKVDIRSGGQNSIHLSGVKAQLLTVNNSNGTSPVRVESSGDTTIDTTVVGTYAIMDSKSGSFGYIEVKRSVSGELIVEFRGTFEKPIKVTDEAIIKSNGADIKSIELAPYRKGANITLDGAFKNVYVTRPVSINTTGGTVINNLIIPQGATGTGIEFTGHGTVGNIQNMSTTAALRIGSAITVTGVIEAVDKDLIMADSLSTAEKIVEKPIDKMTDISQPVLRTPTRVRRAVISITVTGAGNAATVAYGGKLQMSAAVEPINATNKAVTWSIINGTGTATIDTNGLLTAAGVGTVTVKAVAKDGSLKEGIKEITVTNADQAAPEGLAGVVPTAALHDGKITGTTTDMEYKLAADADSAYTPCLVTETTGLTAGNYVVRFKAKTGYNASPTTAVTVPAFYHDQIENNIAALGLIGTTVSSNAEGVAQAQIVSDSGTSFILIEAISAGSAVITVKDAQNHEAAIAVTVAADGVITIDHITKYIATYAVSLGAITRVAGDEESTILINATPAAAGAKVALTVVPKAGMRLKVGTLKVKYNDGLPKQVLLAGLVGSGPYTFTMPAYAVEITAEFELFVYTNVNFTNIGSTSNGYGRSGYHGSLNVSNITVYFLGTGVDNRGYFEVYDVNPDPLIAEAGVSGFSPATQAYFIISTLNSIIDFNITKFSVYNPNNNVVSLSIEGWANYPGYPLPAPKTGIVSSSIDLEANSWTTVNLEGFTGITYLLIDFQDNTPLYFNQFFIAKTP